MMADKTNGADFISFKQLMKRWNKTEKELLDIIATGDLGFWKKDPVTGAMYPQAH